MCPLWPLTTLKRTRCFASNRSSRCQSSRFLTSAQRLPSRRRQPFFFQFGIQLVQPSATYLLSVMTSTTVGRVSDSKPEMTPINSIWLLVVLAAPPESSFSDLLDGCRKMQAQPPGPGLPLHAPSVNNNTSVVDSFGMDRHQAGGLAFAEDDSAAIQVIRRDFHLHFVPWHDTDKVLPHFAGNVSHHKMTILQLDAKLGVGKASTTTPSTSIASSLAILGESLSRTNETCGTNSCFQGGHSGVRADSLPATAFTVLGSPTN